MGNKTTVEEKVKDYIGKRPKWIEVMTALRAMIRETELEETIKWGAPAYTLDGKNVVGLIGVKSYAGLWFYSGVFLEDPNQLLEQSSEQTKGMRKMMFESVEDFEDKKQYVPAYLEEAIKNQKAGKEILPIRNKELDMPAEFQQVLDEDNLLKAAFDKLTPGRQREYAAYIESAKQEATKKRRIDKIRPLIMDGKGLYDKYK